MVLIEAGTFMMGSPSSELDRHSSEIQHQVTITNDYYIGKYEVTQAHWQSVMGNNPSYFSGNPDRPVENVSWNDCQTFINNLNQMGQGVFRLPTEAEWELACRAGTSTRFYWGDDLDESQITGYAWYVGNNIPSETKDVGIKIYNPSELYDMSGNVWEWCYDWYGTYPTSPRTNPFGPYTGTTRVYRGGSWRHSAGDCRSASRYGFLPNGRSYSLGFRLFRKVL